MASGTTIGIRWGRPSLLMMQHALRQSTVICKIVATLPSGTRMNRLLLWARECTQEAAVCVMKMKATAGSSSHYLAAGGGPTTRSSILITFTRSSTHAIASRATCGF